MKNIYLVKFFISTIVFFYLNLHSTFAAIDTISVSQNNHIVCNPDPVVLSFTNTSTVTNFIWKLEDGTLVATTSSSYTLSLTAEKVVKISVYENLNVGGIPVIAPGALLVATVYKSTASADDSIRFFNKPSFTLLQDLGRSCGGKRNSTVSFTNLTGNAPYRSIWVFGDGASQILPPTGSVALPGPLLHSFNLPLGQIVAQTFSSEVSIIDRNGCFTKEAYTTDVSAKIQTNGGALEYSSCSAPATIIFDASSFTSGSFSQGVDITKSYWLFDPILPGIPAPKKVFGITVTKSAIPTGSYDNFFVLVDDLGCVDSLKIDANIFAPAINSFSLVKKRICLGDSINLWDSFSANPKKDHIFNMGDGNTFIADSLLKYYTYSTGGGAFPIKLTITNGSCDTTAIDTIYVVDVEADFITTPSYICQMTPNVPFNVGVKNLSFDKNALANPTQPKLDLALYEWQFRDTNMTRQLPGIHPWAGFVNGRPANQTRGAHNIHFPFSIHKILPLDNNLDDPKSLNDSTFALATLPTFNIYWKDTNRYSTHHFSRNQHGDFFGKIFLRVTTPEGCKDSVTKSFNDTLDLVGSFFTITSSVTSNKCAPVNISFKDSTISGEMKKKVGGINIYKADFWQWDFGDGQTSTDQNPIHTYDAGMYNVRLISGNTTLNCKDTSYYYKVKIGAPPIFNLFTMVDDSTKAVLTTFPIGDTIGIKSRVLFTLGNNVTALDSENISYSLYANSVINKVNPPLSPGLSQNNQCISYDFNTTKKFVLINEFASPLQLDYRICHRGCCTQDFPKDTVSNVKQIIILTGLQVELMAFLAGTGGGSSATVGGTSPRNEKDSLVHSSACPSYFTSPVGDEAISDHRSIRMELKLYGEGLKTIRINYGDGKDTTVKTSGSSYEIMHAYATAGKYTVLATSWLGTDSTKKVIKSIIVYPNYMYLKIKDFDKPFFCKSNALFPTIVPIKISYKGMDEALKFGNEIKYSFYDKDSITQVESFLSSEDNDSTFTQEFKGLGTQKITCVIRDINGCELLAQKDVIMIGVFPSFIPRFKKRVSEFGNYALCPYDTSIVLDNYSKTNKNLRITTMRWNFGYMHLNALAGLPIPFPCNQNEFFDSLNFVPGSGNPAYLPPNDFNPVNDTGAFCGLWFALNPPTNPFNNVSGAWGPNFYDPLGLNPKSMIYNDLKNVIFYRNKDSIFVGKTIDTLYNPQTNKLDYVERPIWKYTGTPVYAPAMRKYDYASTSLDSLDYDNDSLKYIKFDLNLQQNEPIRWSRRNVWVGVFLQNEIGCVGIDTLRFTVPDYNDFVKGIRVDKPIACWDDSIKFNISPAFTGTPAFFEGKTKSAYKLYWRFDDRRALYKRSKKRYQIISKYESDYKYAYKPVSAVLPELAEKVYNQKFPYERDLISSSFRPWVLLEDTFGCKNFKIDDKIITYPFSDIVSIPANASGVGLGNKFIHVYRSPDLDVISDRALNPLKLYPGKGLIEVDTLYRSIKFTLDSFPVNASDLTKGYKFTYNYDTIVVIEKTKIRDRYSIDSLYKDTLCYNQIANFKGYAFPRYGVDSLYKGTTFTGRLLYDFYFSKGNSTNGPKYPFNPIKTAVNPASQDAATFYSKNDVGTQYLKVGVRILPKIPVGTRPFVCPVKFDSIPIFVTGQTSDFKLSDTIVCQDGIIDIDSLNWFNVKSWNWTFGDGTSDSTSTKTFFPKKYSNVINTGVYNITLISYSENRTCKESKTKDIYLAKTFVDFYRNKENAFGLTITDSAHCLGIADSLKNASFVLLTRGVKYFNEVYTWSFGDNLIPDKTGNGPFKIEYTKPGVYEIRVIAKIPSEGCSDTLVKKILVRQNPEIIITVNDTCIESDSTLSRPINLIASGGGPGAIHNWQIVQGAIEPIATKDSTFSIRLNNPSPAQRFFVETIDKYGCKDTASKIAYIIKSPLQNVTGIDTIFYGQTINIGDSLIPDVNNYIFEWNNPTALTCVNCPKPTANPIVDQIYVLTIKDRLGCFVIRDTFEIYVNPLSTVDVPTAFTPNDDGVNDRVYVRGVAIKKLISFKIYNRWGELLYSSADINEGWDGFFRGQRQPIETYVYTAEVETYNPDEAKRFVTKKGTIKIFR